MSHAYGGMTFTQIRRLPLEEYLARRDFAHELLGGGER